MLGNCEIPAGNCVCSVHNKDLKQDFELKRSMISASLSKEDATFSSVEDNLEWAEKEPVTEDKCLIREYH